MTDAAPARGLTILVLAKAPRPGYSKTRLIPAFGADCAARLAGAALADSLDAARRARAAARVLVLDGHADSLPVNGFRIVPQSSGDLGERIVAAFDAAAGAAVLIGMDTPQVTPAELELDLDAPVDAWLGMALDGGWWALGLRHARRDARRVLAGVPMSRSDTGGITRERLVRAGLTVADLPVLRDVDDEADADAVARLAPHTRFARCLNALVVRNAMRR